MNSLSKHRYLLLLPLLLAPAIGLLLPSLGSAQDEIARELSGKIHETAEEEEDVEYRLDTEREKLEKISMKIRNIYGNEEREEKKLKKLRKKERKSIAKIIKLIKECEDDSECEDDEEGEIPTVVADPDAITFDPEGIISCSGLDVKNGRYSLGMKALEGMFPFKFSKCETDNYIGKPCDCFNKISKMDKVYLRSLYKENKEKIEDQTHKYWAEKTLISVFEIANNTMALDNHRQSANLDNSTLGKVSACRVGKMFETIEKLKKSPSCNSSHLNKMANLVFNRDKNGNKDLDTLKKDFKDFLQPLSSNGIPSIKNTETSSKNSCIGFRSFLKHRTDSRDSGLLTPVRVIAKYMAAVKYEEEHNFFPLTNSYITNRYSPFLSDLGSGRHDEEGSRGGKQHNPLSKLGGLRSPSEGYHRSLEKRPALAAALKNPQLRDRLVGLKTNKEIESLLNEKETLDILIADQAKACGMFADEKNLAEIFCNPKISRPSTGAMVASFPSSFERGFSPSKEINESIKYVEMCKENRRTGKLELKRGADKKKSVEEMLNPDNAVVSDLKKLWEGPRLPTKVRNQSAYKKFNEKICTNLSSCRENPNLPKCSDPELMLEDAKNQLLEIAKSNGVIEGSDEWNEFIQKFPDEYIGLSGKHKLKEFLGKSPNLDLFTYFEFATNLRNDKERIAARYAPNPVPEGDDSYEHIFRTESGKNTRDGYISNYLVEGTLEDEVKIAEWERRREAGEEVGTEPPFERRNFEPNTGTNTRTTPTIGATGGGEDPRREPPSTNTKTVNETRESSDAAAKGRTNSSNNLGSKTVTRQAVNNDQSQGSPSNKSGSSSNVTKESPTRYKKVTPQKEEVADVKEDLNNFTQKPSSQIANDDKENYNDSISSGDNNRSGKTNSGISRNRFTSSGSREREGSYSNGSATGGGSAYSLPSSGGSGEVENTGARRSIAGKGESGGSITTTETESSPINGMRIKEGESIKSVSELNSVLSDSGKSWVFERIWKCDHLSNPDADLDKTMSPIGLDGAKFYCVDYVVRDGKKSKKLGLMYFDYDTSYKTIPKYAEIYGDRKQEKNRERFFKDLNNLSIAVKSQDKMTGEIPSALIPSVSRIKLLVKSGSKLSLGEILDYSRNNWIVGVRKPFENLDDYKDQLEKRLITRQEVENYRQRIYGKLRIYYLPKRLVTAGLKR